MNQPDLHLTTEPAPDAPLIPSSDGTFSAPLLQADTFLLYPVHRDYALGKSKKLKTSNRFVLGCIGIFLGIFIVFGVGLIVSTLRDTLEWYVLSRQSSSFTAEYIDRRRSTGDDSDSYYVKFKYVINNQEYVRQQQVEWSIYNSAEVGGRVNIEYVPANPQFAKIAGTNRAPVGMLIFSLLWNVIVSIPIGVVIYITRKQKYLERNGIILRGEILQSSHSTDSDGDYLLKVEYRFQVPKTYQRLTQTVRTTRNDLKGKPLPPAGTPVLVLYHDQKTFMLL